MINDSSIANPSLSVPKADMKRLENDIQSILAQFEKPREWADLTNCLVRLYRIIKHSNIATIPHKETICKRLAQCLNPLLPSGVHIKALEVYGAILEKTTPEGLSKDLALFSTGLFPFFPFSSISVRPIFLDIIDQYYIPLGTKLLPCLIGLLICIIPGLEDEKSEMFSKVYTTLEKISNCVSEKFYMRALWLILLKASKIRLSTLYVIANKLSPGVPLIPMERIEVLLPNRHNLVMRSLKATTEDESMLVLREMINLLTKHFPLDANTFSHEERSDLCKECLKLLTKRDWSLTRRLYQWIFNTTDLNESIDYMDLTYFTTHSKNIIISAIKDLLLIKGKTLEEVLIPIKIIVTFISDIDMAGITDELMPVLCVPILQHICKEKEEPEWRAAIIQETRVIFNTSLTSTIVVFNAIIDHFNSVVAEGDGTEWNELLELCSIYLDEMHTITFCETAICGLFMLLDNSLSNLHKLDIKNDVYLINHLLMYASSTLSRIEAIIKGECNFFCFNEVNLMENEIEEINMLMESQKSCNDKISHYLEIFYSMALVHFERKHNHLTAFELDILDVLNNLAVRFVALEDYLSILPVTHAFPNRDNSSVILPKAEARHTISLGMTKLELTKLDETYYPNQNYSKMLSVGLHGLRNSVAIATHGLVDSANSVAKTESVDSSSPSKSRLATSDKSPTNKVDAEPELENWVSCLLSCATSSNPQLFCRGIRTFTEMLLLPSRSFLKNYISGSGKPLRNIISQLWSSLDEKYVTSHSEIVLLLLQLTSAIPSARDEAEMLIVKDLTTPVNEDKIAAILRFGVFWRFSHIHAPDQIVFPEAVGCILDNVEESDPKLHYYSRAFLSESIHMLSHLLDPIIASLLMFDKNSCSYSSYICEILRKFRHLSSIVGREGQALLDMMQRKQVPIRLLWLVQGEDVYNELAGSATLTGRSNDSPKSVEEKPLYARTCDFFTGKFQTASKFANTGLEDTVVFPRLDDPQGISYSDKCIYDYVDLIVVVTLKYICLNVDISYLLNLESFEDLLSYSEIVQKTEHPKDGIIQENTMMFRCTAIDFMKLFLSCIQPPSRAKEVACLVSRHLLCALYHFHLKDETIVQTQMLYLLKVVMDRCHLETSGLSKATSSLLLLANNISKYPHERKSQFKASDLSGINAQDIKGMDEDGLLKRTFTADTIPEYDYAARFGVHKESVTDDLVSNLSRDPFDGRNSVLPPVYIMNVALIKKAQLASLKRLSDDHLFTSIIDHCIKNSSKIKRPHLLQSYIDFSIYNLKYLNGSDGIKYSASFIREFCNAISLGKGWIGISGLFHYLRGLYFMLNHISEKVVDEGVILRDCIRQSHRGSAGISLNSLIRANSLQGTEPPDGPSWQIFGFGGMKPKKVVPDPECDDFVLFDLSEVLDVCVKALIWARNSLEKDWKGSIRWKKDDDQEDLEEEEDGSTKGVRDSAKKTVLGAILGHDPMAQSCNTETIRLDIIMSVENISKQIMRLFRLLYSRLPYHFTKGCLHVWDMAERSTDKVDIKHTLLNLISCTPNFSAPKTLDYILDMLEPFARTSQYREMNGYSILHSIIRDSSLCEFVYFIITSPIMPVVDTTAIYRVLQRWINFALSFPRQPSVFIWIFHTIFKFDKVHPCSDVNVFTKVGKKLFSDLILVIIHQSAGFYMHKVCSWLQPKFYDLEPPLPLHLLMINNRYYGRMNDGTTQTDEHSAHYGPAGANVMNGSTNDTSRTIEGSFVVALESSYLGADGVAMGPTDCCCNNALAELIFFNYEIGQLNRRSCLTNIFFQTLYKNLSAYLLPMLQDKQESVLHYRYLILLFLKTLPFNLYEGSLLCIKKSIIDHIHSPDFFKTDRRCFRCIITLFRDVVTEECKGTTDRLMKLDWYTSPPHSSVFTSRMVNIQSRIRYLKRLAFVLYACHNDTFAAHISTIIERLAENARAYDDNELRAKCLFVMRVLLIKMSQEHLTLLWPVLLSELIKIFDRERDNLIDRENMVKNGSLPLTSGPSIHSGAPMAHGGPSIPSGSVAHAGPSTCIDNEIVTEDKYVLLSEAIKIIDIACTLRLNDFLIFQWMFVDDISEHSYVDQATVVKKSPSDFKPFLIVVEQLYPDEVRRQLRDFIYRSHKQSYLRVSQRSILSAGSFGDSSSLGEKKESLEHTEDEGMNDDFKHAESFKHTENMIDLSIENELLELDPHLVDAEVEINLYQIHKTCKRVYG